VSQFFSQDYSEARARFLKVCRGCRATIHSYGYERVNDHVPVELAIDTARFGPVNSSRTLVLISGRHGVEGFSGSACQIAFAVGESWKHLPTDTSVAM
jgi:hypothetical protein